MIETQHGEIIQTSTRADKRSATHGVSPARPKRYTLECGPGADGTEIPSKIVANSFFGIDSTVLPKTNGSAGTGNSI